MRHPALLLAALAGGGCVLDANTFSTSASVRGTIQGGEFKPADTFSTVEGGSAVIVLATEADSCGRYGAGKQKRSVKTIFLTLADVSGTARAAPTAPGTYEVRMSGAGKLATAGYAATDAGCGRIASSVVLGTSGTVTLTSANSNGYAGSADVTFAGGDRVTIDFISPACAVTGIATPDGLGPIGLTCS